MCAESNRRDSECEMYCVFAVLRECLIAEGESSDTLYHFFQLQICVYFVFSSVPSHGYCDFHSASRRKNHDGFRRFFRDSYYFSAAILFLKMPDIIFPLIVDLNFLFLV